MNIYQHAHTLFLGQTHASCRVTQTNHFRRVTLSLFSSNICSKTNTHLHAQTHVQQVQLHRKFYSLCISFVDLRHARKIPEAKLESFHPCKRPLAQRSSGTSSHTHSQTPFYDKPISFHKTERVIVWYI